jgi:hypothetical protein
MKFITPKQVRDFLFDANESLKEEAYFSSELYDEVDRKITSVQSEIEGFLGYELMVKEYKDYFYKYDWKDREFDRQAGPDRLYYQYTRFAPIVEITEDVDFVEDRHIIFADEQFEEVNYIAGYRRHNQNLTSLQSDIAALTALPPTLPEDIVDVGLTLISAELDHQEKQLYSQDSIITQTEGNSVTVQRPQSNWKYQQLMRIAHHKNYNNI